MSLRKLFIAVLGVASLACPGAMPRQPDGPRSLLTERADGGRIPVDSVAIGDEPRDALLASASWSLKFPAKAVLTLGVGTTWTGVGDPPGWARFTVTLDGREIARATVNPRVIHEWKDLTVEIEHPPAAGVLAIDMRFTDKDGNGLELPARLRLAVSDPVLHDRAAYGRQKGVILISIDTLRRDHVGAYGYPKPTTPTLDALAKSGLLAEDAVSVSSWTLPSHLSMLTSTLPGTHGGTDMKQAFNRSVPSVAEILKGRGVATHAVTSHLYVSRTYGLDAGFDSMNFRQDRAAANVADHAVSLIDRFGDRPFFLFLHFYDPHWHYAPPPEVLKLFETSYAGTLSGNLKDFQNLRPDQVKPADLAHLLALYDGEIRYADNEVGRILRYLRERGAGDNTLLVATSDHGEEFLDHGSWEHQKTLYEEVVRVPLIVAGAGVAPRREAKPVNLLDVAPTILDFLGVPPGSAMKGASLLKPLSDVREMYGETDHTTDGTRLTFLRGGAKSWKAILRTDPKTQRVNSSEWYDLAVDPSEQQNRPPVDSLRATIEARAKDAAFKSRSAASAKAAQLTAEQKEKLRALGYIGR